MNAVWSTVKAWFWKDGARLVESALSGMQSITVKLERAVERLEAEESKLHDEFIKKQAEYEAHVTQAQSKITAITDTKATARKVQANVRTLLGQ